MAAGRQLWQAATGQRAHRVARLLLGKPQAATQQYTSRRQHCNTNLGEINQVLRSGTVKTISTLKFIFFNQ
jgi:hypothetical protein